MTDRDGIRIIVDRAERLLPGDVFRQEHCLDHTFEGMPWQRFDIADDADSNHLMLVYANGSEMPFVLERYKPVQIQVPA